MAYSLQNDAWESKDTIRDGACQDIGHGASTTTRARAREVGWGAGRRVGLTAGRWGRALGLPFLGALALTGCTLLPVGGRPTAARAGGPSPLGHGLREYRVAFHVHCYLSHDSEGTIDEIADAARDLGLDAVILNDHYRLGNVARAPSGFQRGVLFVPGAEVRGGGGSLLPFNLCMDFYRGAGARQTLEALDRQGAVTVLGHVEQIQDWDLEPVEAFEVYNLHAEFVAAPRLLTAVRFLFLPPDAFFEASIDTPSENLRAWDRELARGRRLAPLAGHDAHQNIHIFGPLGGTVGTYPEIFRLFSTHVLAPRLSADAIARAVEAGRTFVVFEYLGDGTGFAMSYGEAGAPVSRRAILGDSVPFDPQATLDISVPGDAEDLAVAILRDGDVIGRESTPRVEMPLPGPGVYRVEVYRGERLWIISAPIYVGPAP